MPSLSICVPSRNRQDSFRQTIIDLMTHPRGDVEFVFADNSTDPTIMNDFMAGLTGDPRIRYLASTDQALPMQDNWERTMAAASGDWICFIGDDDYVDPDVIDTVQRIVDRRPAVDAIGWNAISFKWPNYRPFPANSPMSLGTDIRIADRNRELRALFGWQGAGSVPKSVFSPYHGAVRRETMDAVKARFSNRYFEHPTVDFDCSGKLLLTAREFAYADRPFSVLGTTAKSNSAAAGRFNLVAGVHETLKAEKAPDFDVPDFPFTSRLGVAASILAAQEWFKLKYGLRFDGWEENFARAISIDCGHAEDRASFDLHAEQCREAFALWQGGKFASLFNPRFAPRGKANIYTGLHGQYLYVDETIGDGQTPLEFYRIMQSIIAPAQNLKLTFDAGMPVAQASAA